MQRAKVNGIELEYEVSGTGQPVLLISPVLADSALPLAEELSAEDLELIRYHKRGWVGSTHTPGPVTIEDHAADAVALLDHIGADRVHVVGHSSGAAVGAQVTLEHPERVATLALLEVSPLSWPSGQEFAAAAAPAFDAYERGDHEDAIAMFLSGVSGLDWPACREVLELRMPGSVARAVKDADTFFGIELPSLMQWTFGPEQAAAIRQPVLSVVGRDTAPFWVEVAGFLRSNVPNVEEAVIEGVGHLLHIQEPAPVAAAVAGFLRRNAI
jgi:pimeloyl-ACP methyl ester carboxylesterase